MAIQALSTGVFPMLDNINSMIMIDRAVNHKKHIALEMLAFPFAGNSKPITLYKLDELNREYDGELEIVAKRSPTEHRILIKRQVSVTSRNGVRAAIRKLADSLHAHLGLNALTQL